MLKGIAQVRSTDRKSRLRLVCGRSAVLEIGITRELANFLTAPAGSNHLSRPPRVVNVAIVMEEVRRFALGERRNFKVSVLSLEIALQQTTH